ncbi:MAG: ATP-grasp domain-containing protein, partial [Acidimicrobiia bacterium]|nr:ATP-grasp domain-containing protein [Acidimicrobiia bacterium]
MSTFVELAAAGTGAVLLLTAAVWSARIKREAVRQLRLALLDPEPSTRKSAVYVAAERGLAPFADLLVERVREERSPDVRRALAEAVARTQWEPSDSGPLVELRVWAQGELASAAAAAPPAAAVAPPSAVAHPAAVAHPSTTPAPSDASNLSDLENRRRKRAQTAHGRNIGEVSGPETSMAAAPAAVSVAADELSQTPEPIIIERPVRTIVRRPARVTVVVTGAGGPAGIAVVRALAAAGHRVVAADVDPLAAGMRLAPRSAVLPRVDDPTYVERLCEVAFDNGARAVIPTLAEELVVLAHHRGELEEVGVESWVPDPAAVEACCDKWQFAQALKRVRLSGPATNLGSAEGVPGPWVVKPRRGRGSRDVYLVDDADELTWALARVPEPIVQTRLEGREFTVDALVDRDGKLA